MTRGADVKHDERVARWNANLIRYWEAKYPGHVAAIRRALAQKQKEARA